NRPKTTSPAPASLPTAPQRPAPPPVVYPLRPRETPQPLNIQAVDQIVSTASLLQNWKSSIAGLIDLAQKNLASADWYLKKGNYDLAVEFAATSTENMSRALLYCYGEKPELRSGQEEALRLLARRRFREAESKSFQMTIEEYYKVYKNNLVSKYLKARKLSATFIFTPNRTALIVQAASNVVTGFDRIICENFETEIPELGERCPKCFSMATGVLGFDKTIVNYVCYSCGNSWTAKRT
ncbi:MAG: hypothetical protein QXJ02_05410, partial [Candidatus Bathyarchaeia archaeon]